MNDDIEDVLARMKPSGVAPEMRPRVLEAVAVELAASQGTTLACVHPSGHRFICDRCGIVVQPPSRARRWAMTAVLTAMTSAAAVLLMIVIADRRDRVAGRTSEMTAMSSTTSGQSSSGVTASERQTKHAPAIETASASQKSGTSIADVDASSRFLLAQRPDGRRILSAAGFELLDGRIAQLEGPATQNHTSAIDIESNDTRITNGALLDSILLKVGVGGSSADPSHRQSTILPGSRS
jgi:hypothetical protein